MEAFFPFSSTQLADSNTKKSSPLFFPPQSSVILNNWGRTLKRQRHEEEFATNKNSIPKDSHEEEPLLFIESNLEHNTRDLSSQPKSIYDELSKLDSCQFKELTQLSDRRPLDLKHPNFLNDIKNEDTNYTKEFFTCNPSKITNQNIYDNSELFIFTKPLTELEIAKLLKAKEKMEIENEYIKNSEEKLENSSQIVNNQISNVLSSELISTFYDDRPHQCQVCGLRFKASHTKLQHLEQHYEEIEEKRQVDLQLSSAIKRSKRVSQFSHSTSHFIPKSRRPFKGLSEWIKLDYKSTENSNSNTFNVTQSHFEKVNFSSYIHSINSILSSDLPESNYLNNFIPTRTRQFLSQSLKYNSDELSSPIQLKDELNSQSKLTKSLDSEQITTDINTKKSISDLWRWAVFREDDDGQTSPKQQDFISKFLSNLGDYHQDTISFIVKGFLSIIELFKSQDLVPMPLLMRILFRIIRVLSTKKVFLENFYDEHNHTGISQSIADEFTSDFISSQSYSSQLDDTFFRKLFQKILTILNITLNFLNFSPNSYKKMLDHFSNDYHTSSQSETLDANYIPVDCASYPFCPICLDHFICFWNQEQTEWAYYDSVGSYCSDLTSLMLKNKSDNLIGNNFNLQNFSLDFNNITQFDAFSAEKSFFNNMENLDLSQQNNFLTLSSTEYYAHLLISSITYNIFLPVKFETLQSSRDTLNSNDLISNSKDSLSFWNFPKEIFWSLPSEFPNKYNNRLKYFTNKIRNQVPEKDLIMSTDIVEDSAINSNPTHLYNKYDSKKCSSILSMIINQFRMINNSHQWSNNPIYDPKTTSTQILSAHPDCWLSYASIVSEASNEVSSNSNLTKSSVETSIMTLIEIIETILKSSRNIFQ